MIFIDFLCIHRNRTLAIAFIKGYLYAHPQIFYFLYYNLVNIRFISNVIIRYSFNFIESKTKRYILFPYCFSICTSCKHPKQLNNSVKGITECFEEERKPASSNLL